MDTSSAGHQSRSAWLLGIIGRPTLLVSALTTAMLVLAVSCGGGNSDANDNEDDERTFTVQTFTPAPTSTPTMPGSTPEAAVTEAAQRTAAANTATAIAENPSEPTVTVTPGGPEDDAFRPPATELSDGENQMTGVFGAYRLWIDDEKQNFADIPAVFYDVGDSGLTVAPGGELEFSFVEEVDPPQQSTVSVFTWDENSAIPSDGTSVGAHPVFVRGSEPVSTATFPDANPTFALPDEPGRYVVLVEVNWPPDERLPPELQFYANYAFTVYVS